MSPLQQMLTDVDETNILFDTSSLDTDGDGVVNISEEPFFNEVEIVTESGTVISGTAAGGPVDALADLGFSAQDRVTEALDRAEAALDGFAAFRSFSDFDFFI